MAAVVLARTAPAAVRLLAPQFYLIAGYWLPALIVDAMPREPVPSRFERALQRTDLFLRPRLPGVLPWIAVLCETAYLLCYPIVPLALALVWVQGGGEAVPRFWMTVVMAGFACYVTLPWLLSRPPAREGLGAMTLRRVNRHVLARVSHTWTTFPSGHVAVSWAAAVAVWRVSPASGVMLAIVACGVSVGAAAGRYHYVIDVLLGGIVAAVALVIT
jgi:hypothetical protein